MEFKYTWFEELMKEDSGLAEDIRKLRRLVENFGTELAYVCLLTDVETEEDFEKLLNWVKDKIDERSKEKFRIALGSWNKESLWSVERV